MTVKIEQHSDGQRTTIRLIGQIHEEHLEALKALMQGSGPRIVLDLDEVTLVDVDVVRFLNVCEAAGSTIRHGPPYIREWMRREQNRHA
jgi:anti-anti-sigma regulatory factor